jgi:8-oxo-dGTP diphosphatase
LKQSVNVTDNPTITLVVALALGPKDGRWLMHQRPLDKAHGGLWEFPGGKVELAETIENAMKREAFEELGIGIEVDNLVPCGFASSPNPAQNGSIVILLYTAAHWTGDPRSKEGGDVRWVTPAEAFTLDRPPLDIELCAQLFTDDRPQPSKSP